MRHKMTPAEFHRDLDNFVTFHGDDLTAKQVDEIACIMYDLEMVIG